LVLSFKKEHSSLLAESVIATARENPVNAELLRLLPALNLPQCHLVAGCVYQATWNRISGRAAGWGIKDYDVFYFDDRDLSWDAEAAVTKRAADLLGPLAAQVEIKNQARVHLWYPWRFNAPYPQLRSARDGIDLYLVECTCVGIDVAGGALYAPYGLDDLERGVLRLNRRIGQVDLFREKARSYRDRWPWLTIPQD
jgi:hypothetical protein